MSPSFQDLKQLTPQQRTLLARKLRAKRQQTAQAEEVVDTIPRRAEGGPVPASFAQRRLWFLEQLSPGHRAYHLGLALRIEGALDGEALEQSLVTLVARHEALRTTFRAVEGEPVQVVAERLSVVLPCEPSEVLGEGGGEGLDEVAQEMVRDAFAQPFDLEKGPLWRGRLVRFRDEDHLFVLVLHHIITDGWSQGVLRQELSVLYEAFHRGAASPLAELAVQYPDFSVWQHQQLRGETLSQQLNIWRQSLRGLTPLELPADRPRRTLTSGWGRRHLLEPSPTTSKRVGVFSREQGATPFMVLLAVFAGLLGRVCGQKDFAIGSPVANRQRAELEGVLGFFVNMLVLRLDLSADPTFEELVVRTREMALAAYGSQDIPFEKLVEELAPERELGKSPLFQTTFAVQNTESAPFALDGLQVEPAVGSGEVTSRFDLELFAWEDGAAWRFAWIAAADRFDGSTVQRFAQHYETLLSAALENPQIRLSELPLLGTAERHQAVVEWNDTDVKLPEQSIHQLVKSQAQKTPRAVAVQFEEEMLTYGELWGQVDNLAKALRGLGVGPEVVVGLCVDRGLGMMVAMLGILEAGGAYLPLDPWLPEDRLIFMVEDAKIGTFVTESTLAARMSALAESVAALGVGRLLLDEPWPTDQHLEQPGDAVEERVGVAERLAYVMYTSGSTGRPKGVGVSHGNVVNLLRSVGRRPSLSRGETLLALTTLSFDIAVVDLFLPLVEGARLELAPAGIAADGEGLARILKSSKATLLQATPTTWRLLLATGWRGGGALRLISTGEALPPSLGMELMASGDEVWNFYGPTETTVWSTGCQVKASDLSAGKVSIGSPLENTSVHVLDGYLRSVPRSGVGELVIGGRGVSRGYVRRPALTAEHFVPDPFGVEGGRLYRTGDRVRRDHTGQLMYFGRLDQQVKVRGYRIELGEIEAVLGEHPEVEQAVVGVHQESDGNSILVAWVVPVTGAEPTVGMLRELVGRKLPTVMVPAACVLLEDIPRTTNGKVDRLALARGVDGLLAAAEPVGSSRGQKGLVASRNRHELHLLSLFEQVLRKNPIGVEDNFFELGGHSLLATRLFALIEKSFDQALPISTLFQAPTVAGLAKVLRDEGHATIWSSVVPIHPWGERPPLFCVHGITGDPFVYRHLAQYLSPDQPLYGLRAQGLDGESEPFDRVENMATHYLEEIQRLQPQGPYFLGGFCFGGTVASEIARQFLAQGEEVALLAIFDTQANISSALPMGIHRRYGMSYTMRQVKRHFAKTKGLPSHRRLGVLSARAAKILWRIVSRGWQRRKVPQPVDGAPATEKSHEVTLANRRASWRYAPDFYPGKVTLFRSIDSIGSIFLDPQLGWQVLATGGLEILDVPGLHHAMFDKPHVQVLAERLQSRLDRASSEMSAAERTS